MKHYGPWIALFFVCWFIGQYARNERVFSYIHEKGHVMAAEREGKSAYIDTQYSTQINGALTHNILVSGYWTEMIVWTALAIALSLFKHAAFGALAGFCFGFQNTVYYLAYQSTDFAKAGAYAPIQWKFWGVLLIGVMYLILATRLYRRVKEDNALDRSSNHSKDEQRKDTEQGSGTDLRTPGA
jgi:hypothetical protein